MPTKDVRIWNGIVSDNVHDTSSQAASDTVRNPSSVGPKSSSTSTATSTTTESTGKSSGKSDGASRRGINTRRFPFSSGSMEMKTPPPPPTTSEPVITTVDVKRTSVFPVGWIFGSMVRDVYTAISHWILEGLSAWLLQRSFLGNVHRQVFRDLRHRMKTGPLSILVTPPPMDEISLKKTPQSSSDRDTRVKPKTVKLVEEPETELLLGGGIAPPAEVTQEEPAIVDEGSSHTVQWVIFAIEVMALIPIVVIGLSLFYILAVGIYNDVQDLLRRLFGDGGNSDSTNADDPPSPLDQL
uniref:Uncharacterized protein n=1 Tax=Strigamia maritima TaxID=126957 RepID=T1J992_STRMM